MAESIFIKDDFMLETSSGRRLYHEYASEMPIIDYHCHLSPREIAQDKYWENITGVWLHGDHYKWRAMRSCGIEERYCSGEASDWEKFEAFASVMPYLIRNPIYHWSHLELARYFGISDCLLGSQTAKEIWERTREVMGSGLISARKVMQKSNVKVVCTTDDPTDSLEYHESIAADESFDIKVLPTWRPDKGMAVESPKLFNAWVDRLEAVANVAVNSFQNYLEAIRIRHDFFDEAGCKLSDYAISSVHANAYTNVEIEYIFQKIRTGTALNTEEIDKLKSAMLYEYAGMDYESGWTVQLHIGALRNNNSRLFDKLGPDIGCDSIDDQCYARDLARFLDRLDREGRLAKTIIYNLNPKDNEMIATMIGNFQDSSAQGKIQFGSGWWFLDQKNGMERHIEALSQLGVLSKFVGMLTDSRSFLSYTRHEYFRRILCNVLGKDMDMGLIPMDMELVGNIVRDICFGNANNYFGFHLS